MQKFELPHYRIFSFQKMRTSQAFAEQNPLPKIFSKDVGEGAFFFKWPLCKTSNLDGTENRTRF